MQHLDEGTIHAWLDGALDAAEGARVEAHAAACAECSARVAEARGLIAASTRILIALDDVPGGVIPQTPAQQQPVQQPQPAAAPDVLPISTAAPARAPRRGWGVGPKWRLAAAAAVLLMAGTSVVTLSRAGRDDYNFAAASRAEGPTADSAAPADLSAITTTLDSATVPEKTAVGTAEAQANRVATGTAATPAPASPPVASGRALGGALGGARGAAASAGAGAGISAAAPPPSRDVAAPEGAAAGGPTRQARADSVARAPALTSVRAEVARQQPANVAADEAQRRIVTPTAPSAAPRRAVDAVAGAVVGSVTGREESSGAAGASALRDRRQSAAKARDSAAAGLAQAPTPSAPPPAIVAAPTRAESIAASDAARATAELRARQSERSAEAVARVRPPSPGSFIGCYALTLDGWAPSAPTSRDGAAVPLPPGRIELTGSAAPAESGAAPAFIARAPEAGLAFNQRAAGRARARDAGPRSTFWRPLSGDSVEVVWSDGTRGVRLRLLAEANGTLRGEARTFGDAARPEQRARATAVKEGSCAR